MHSTRCLVAVLAVALAATPALAKKKKSVPTAAQSQKGKDKRAPQPNDKGANEGAQGRMNATEDASRAADSPQFEHRP